MNKYWTKMMLGVTFFALPLIAQEPMARPPEELKGDEDCAKEALTKHYPEKFVKVTLTKYNVPASEIDPIVKELNEKEKDIVKAVEEKASKMDPNPLKDPKLRQQAVKLFRDTLQGEFAEVLNKHGIKDPLQIQNMMDDIQLQKAKQFTECMERLHPEIKNKKPVEGQGETQ